MGVQWLRLCASTAGDMGPMPGWGNQDPEMSCSVAKKIEKEIAILDTLKEKGSDELNLGGCGYKFFRVWAFHLKMRGK